MSASPLHLLRERRFGPFFITQFLGAFNDNFFKNALVVLLTFNAAHMTSLPAGILVNLAAGIFILPFFVFSALAGQLADKYEKSRLIRGTKVLEIIIALTGACAFARDSLGLLLLALFLMGLQSTLFGPVKYAILPQNLREDELIGGNALVESGTFLAILAGTIAGGLVVKADAGTRWVSVGMVIFAIAGYVCSRAIPASAAADPQLRIRWNPLSETWSTVRLAMRQRVVFLAILGNSWFWFYGALFMSQFPGYAKEVLGGSEGMVTLMLAMFSIGIGLGSMLCERLSLRRVEIGLVPVGSVGLSVFAMDLWLATPDSPPVANGSMLALLMTPYLWRIFGDLVLIGIFGGLYIVPLYALIQSRSEPVTRSRTIACNNIINALFMVAAAGMGAILLALGASIAQLILMTAVLNAIIATYIYTLVPEFVWRFFIWLSVQTIYRFKMRGRRHIPQTGAAVLVANHHGLQDIFVMMAISPRPVRVVVDARYMRWPLLGFVLRGSGAIGVPGLSEGRLDAAALGAQVRAALQKGLVCVFLPKGGTGANGPCTPAQEGMAQWLSLHPDTLMIPVKIRREPSQRRVFWEWCFSALQARVRVVVGEPVLASHTCAQALAQRAAQCLGENAGAISTCGKDAPSQRGPTQHGAPTD